MTPLIILADEHPINRTGMEALLNAQLCITNIGYARSSNELLNELARKEYTHLILDVILSDGNTLEILPRIRKLCPKLKIMLYSRNQIEIYTTVLKNFGIHFSLSKEASEDETISVIKKFLSNEISLRNVQTLKISNPFSSLASREMEIMYYIVKGYGSKYISETLKVRINTVSTIKRKIFEKTATGNVQELIKLASIYNMNV